VEYHYPVFHHSPSPIPSSFLDYIYA
jgi:hypothetical protein